jgi:BirA family biotin operon repressor/biotin-[acetyl-CoA-carboxylase] ligase
MNGLTFAALRLLADGDFHSGEQMAATLRVTRGSIWNAMRGLERSGIEVFKVRGRGYRLAEPLELLDAGRVAAALGPVAGRLPIDVVERVESTNSLLLDRAAAGAVAGSVIAAEWQTAGRGRRGRRWHSGLGAALTFSLLWRFEQGAAFLAGLSLAVGVAVLRSLDALGVGPAAVKWPNDVLWDGRKLAGILVEMQGDALGPSTIVIGIGLNYRLGGDVIERIDVPASDLAVACGGSPPGRNAALAALLRELVLVLDRFAADGFAPFRDEWQQRHFHQGKAVELSLPDGAVARGSVAGVAEDGAILLSTPQGMRRFYAGDVSLRQTT